MTPGRSSCHALIGQHRTLALVYPLRTDDQVKRLGRGLGERAGGRDVFEICCPDLASPTVVDKHEG
jgi:hypothetical protein